jgi:hypothetical protein
MDPDKWLLTYALPSGAPWGAGTRLAERAKTAGAVPWDTNCRVTPIVGGYNAMSAMRDALESLITDARASSRPAGQRGHVYIADWRLSCQRDLSSRNPWGTRP